MSLDSASIGSKRLSGRVPSDQKCLLKSQGSWAADLGNQPCSPTHIPGHITEAAKSAHRTQEEESEVQTIQSKKRRATSPMSPTGSKRVQNNDATAPKSNSDGLPQSSPGESIPWSCNPAREQPGLVASECTATSMANQSPLDVAGGSGLRQGQHPSISASPDLPSSESEYRMETKIPDARPLLDTCIRREVAHSSQSMPSPLSTKQPRTTPPCAQLINYTKSSGHDAGARDGMSSNVKKRAEGCENLLPSEKIDVDGSDEEMMKDFPGKDHLRHTTMAPASGSPAPTSSSESLMPVVYDIPLMQDIVRGSTQVNETGTPSAAMRDIMGRSPSYPLMSAANPDPLADAETGSCQDKLSVRRDQERQIKAHQIQRPSTMTLNSPPRRTASTSSRQPSATNRIPTRLPSPAQPCIAPGAHCEPFETFVQYYPEYASGDGGQVAAATKSDFMTACVYLNYLRSRNKLQEGLYDEFIRTFPRYYNKYLDKCRTQGRKPLIAVAWFNKQTGPLIFDKYLVYRRNLSHILRMYPYEFEMIKEKLEDGGGGDVVIYTSSEDEGDISEGQGTASPVSVQRGEKAPEASPPIASLESQPGKTLSQVFAATRFYYASASPAFTKNPRRISATAIVDTRTNAGDEGSEMGALFQEPCREEPRSSRKW
ncbi:uncharacterized protein FPOAC1_013454 [Fusarium poae]|uniref:uncharacterized protein n=1 Tax=Fusarium poae TaxID=36050 RepID=UPI001D042554|nr:uncharacterized protein FPOAC1_013454 [Fusarium poae]KAG8664674.1 hypothetical protein FPOAC1_013454 [Fusarium poae]